MRTRRCTSATIAGRQDKAKQYAVAAEALSEDDTLGDAYVTNCVHAGIAAADVICCARISEHSVGENHNDAADLLAPTAPDGRELANHLRTLLSMKTKAGYGAQLVGRTECVRAGRAMAALVDAMHKAS